MPPKTGRQRAISFALLLLWLLGPLGCMSHYEPTAAHTYTTSTQLEYRGTGLNVELRKGNSINADHWVKILVDGRKVLETHGWAAKSTFIALPHGNHQLRIVEWNTGWIVPSEGGTGLFEFTLSLGQRGTFTMDMDGLMFMQDRPATKWAEYCDWSGVDRVQRQGE